ncbi:MAG TPA: hypothetical protein VF042_13450 [Gemmatimonadaceae bacterium]
MSNPSEPVRIEVESVVDEIDEQEKSDTDEPAERSDEEGDDTEPGDARLRL